MKILVGDTIEQMATLEPETVQCIVTSPPYWGLRDYGVAGQLGLEDTPGEYIEKMVEVFREARRVLRKDGTLWLNMGDSYASGKAKAGYSDTGHDMGYTNEQSRKAPPGLKPKDLVGTPWRLAFALQADGWWLRSDIIWAKPNPMPESCRDRPTSAHEHIFLLTRSPRYFYDIEAVKEPASYQDWERRLGQTGPQSRRPTDKMAGIRERTPSGWNINHDESDLKGRYPQKNKQWPGIGPQHAAARDRGEKYEPMATHAVRNLRNVWTLATQSYPDAHFATFPEALAKRCLLAGTSAKGACPDCGAPWERVVEKEFIPQDDVSAERGKRNAVGNKSMDHRKDGDTPKGTNDVTTTGWRPTCDCGEPETVPCAVMDPFAGSGTVGKVAIELGLEPILIELNPEYIPMIEQRTLTTIGMNL